ncbi:hypothetical protein L1D15_05045 [Vibrio sp. Isolate25]|nr:hypothetical protein [Vibrio sp. Isolate25]MCG9596087.1 hypothetical protein [Vibrio sp. Isolate25]
MNNAQAIVAQSAEHAISPKREIVLREMLSLAKMASVIAVPFLFLSLAWI